MALSSLTCDDYDLVFGSAGSLLAQVLCIEMQQYQYAKISIPFHLTGSMNSRASRITRNMANSRNALKGALVGDSFNELLA